MGTDDAECPSSLRHVEEAGELNKLVDRVATSAGEEADAVFSRFAQIVSGCGMLQKALATQSVAATAASPLLPLPPGSRCSSALFFIQQVGKYQEQPQLLDPLLEDIVTPLTALLRAAAADPAAADLLRVRGISRLLWQLSIVRWRCRNLALLKSSIACRASCMERA